MSDLNQMNSGVRKSTSSHHQNCTTQSHRPSLTHPPSAQVHASVTTLPSRPTIVGYMRRLSHIWQDSLSSPSHPQPSVTFTSGTTTPSRRSDRTTSPTPTLTSPTAKTLKQPKSNNGKPKQSQLVRLLSIATRQSDDDSDEETCDIHDSPAWWILVRLPLIDLRLSDWCCLTNYR